MKENKSVNNMWQAFLVDQGQDPLNATWTYTSWHFEVTKEAANKLAKLVLKGQKRATASSMWVELHDSGVIPKVGDYSIITDWDGKAQCIIQTTQMDIVPYKDVTEEFARWEGEGDLSLDYWKAVHEVYYKKECERIKKAFTEEMPVLCERFKLVYK